MSDACHVNIYFTSVLDKESCVVHSNNDTAQSCVGSYVIQSFTITWRTKNSPDLGVITESRSTLHQLLQGINVALSKLSERLVL